MIILSIDLLKVSIYPAVQSKLNKSEQRRYRHYFRRRAAVEGIISHMKHGYGMGRNYLKGELGDQSNCLLAGIGFNLGSYLKKLATSIKNIFCFLLQSLLEGLIPTI